MGVAAVDDSSLRSHLFAEVPVAYSAWLMARAAYVDEIAAAEADGDIVKAHLRGKRALQFLSPNDLRRPGVEAILERGVAITARAASAKSRATARIRNGDIPISYQGSEGSKGGIASRVAQLFPRRKSNELTRPRLVKQSQLQPKCQPKQPFQAQQQLPLQARLQYAGCQVHDRLQQQQVQLQQPKRQQNLLFQAQQQSKQQQPDSHSHPESHLGARQLLPLVACFDMASSVEEQHTQTQPGQRLQQPSTSPQLASLAQEQSTLEFKAPLLPNSGTVHRSTRTQRPLQPNTNAHSNTNDQVRLNHFVSMFQHCFGTFWLRA